MERDTGDRPGRSVRRHGGNEHHAGHWDEPIWPSDADCRALGGWAAALGPNGSFWTGTRAGQAHLAARWVEFGNELSYTSRQFGPMPGRAQTYARKARIAADAVAAANPGVSLLIDAEVSTFGAGWITQLKAAVPDLDQRIGGWVVHPYGSNYLARIQNTIDAIRRVGWPCDASKPIFVTEYGVFSRDGRRMDANYGWDPCATYPYAADTLTTTVSWKSNSSMTGAAVSSWPRGPAPHDVSPSGWPARRRRPDGLHPHYPDPGSRLRGCFAGPDSAASGCSSRRVCPPR